MYKIFFVIFVFLKKYREQMVFLCSKYWEAQSATRDTDDVVVEGRRDERVLGIVGSNGSNGGIGSGWDDGDVGELAVVGTSHWINGEEVEGVRVHVVTGLQWDDWGVEPWVDKREVVGAHLVDTLGVLINERGVDDRVGTGLKVNHTEQGVRLSNAIGWAKREVLIGRVVGPFGRNGGIAASPEESLDRVRETNVDRSRRVWVKVLDGRGLHLLDEDVTWCASHLLTFIVGHDGIVGPHVDA